MKNKLIAELIGTYFLYLTIGLCITPPGAEAFTPIAVGLGLTALVYACGHISKAHFNPATTVTYLCAGTHPARQLLPYLIVILIGAVLSATTIGLLNPEGLKQVAAIEIDIRRVLVAEFVFTFALMWIILNVAIAKGTAGNQFYGLAIGFKSFCASAKVSCQETATPKAPPVTSASLSVKSNWVNPSLSSSQASNGAGVIALGIGFTINPKKVVL